MCSAAPQSWRSVATWKEGTKGGSCRLRIADFSSGKDNPQLKQPQSLYLRWVCHRRSSVAIVLSAAGAVSRNDRPGDVTDQNPDWVVSLAETREVRYMFVERSGGSGFSALGRCALRFRGSRRMVLVADGEPGKVWVLVSFPVPVDGSMRCKEHILCTLVGDGPVCATRNRTARHARCKPWKTPPTRNPELAALEQCHHRGAPKKRQVLVKVQMK